MSVRRIQTIVVAVVLAAGVAGAAGWLHARRGAGENAREIWDTFVARRAPFRVFVSETGQLRPRDVIIVPGTVSGEIVELIDEGTYVKEGDRLAVIDDAVSMEAAETMRFTLDASVTRLKRQQADLRLLETTLELDRRLADVARRESLLALTELQDAPTTSELEAATLAAQQAKLQQANALQYYETQKGLGDEGVIANSDVVRARLAYERARARNEQTDVELELTAKGAPIEDIKIAGERLRQSEIALRQIEETTSAQLALKLATVAVAQAQVDLTSQTLARHEKIVAGAFVLAPAEGTVLYNVHWGRPEEGKRIWRGNGLIDIVNLSKMLIDTQVNEMDVQSVGVGQNVLVRLEAFPDKQFHGTVTHVAGLATDRSDSNTGFMGRAPSGVMIFEVEVEIEEADPLLRPTMTANIDIIVDEIPDAIAVPYRAIIEEDDRYIVHVLKNGRPTPRSVKIGVAGSSRIVIEEGLEEGDVVCVFRRNR